MYVPEHTGRAALAELRNVDWARLRSAAGLPGTEQRLLDPRTGEVVVRRVPSLAEMMRAIVEGGAAARREAQDALVDSMYRHSSTWPVTYHALPFLAALLAGDDAPDRERIAALVVYVFHAWLEDERGLEVFRACRAHLERARALGPDLVTQALAAVLAWDDSPLPADGSGDHPLMELAHALEDAS